eukprot:6198046-Pleurochrysis_carterae.AAC.1
MPERSRATCVQRNYGAIYCLLTECATRVKGIYRLAPARSLISRQSSIFTVGRGGGYRYRYTLLRNPYYFRALLSSSQECFTICHGFLPIGLFSLYWSDDNHNCITLQNGTAAQNHQNARWDFDDEHEDRDLRKRIESGYSAIIQQQDAHSSSTSSLGRVSEQLICSLTKNKNLRVGQRARHMSDTIGVDRWSDRQQA